MSSSYSGGFMDTSVDNSSSANGSFARKPLGEQTLRPLTIKQMKLATVPQENLFKVDDAPVTQVTFVGVIRNIQEHSTYHEYTIEDGTGAISVKKWAEAEEAGIDADSRRTLLTDSYVRVNGRLNHFSNRMTIVAHNLRPITDFNEITYHLLETIHTHWTLTKPGTSSDDMQIDSTQPTGARQRVNAALREYDDIPEGASIHQIVQKLSGVLPESEVRDAISVLMEDGVCYTTIDSDHYKSCLP